MSNSDISATQNDAISLWQLSKMCLQLLKDGANPNKTIMVYSDPEGNSLSMLSGFAGLVTMSSDWLATDVHPDSGSAYSEDQIKDSNNHVVLGSYTTIYWDESQWEKIVPQVQLTQLSDSVASE